MEKTHEERRRELLDNLIRCGQLLSNIAFNAARRPMDANDKDNAEVVRRQWDQAEREYLGWVRTTERKTSRKTAKAK